MNITPRFVLDRIRSMLYLYLCISTALFGGATKAAGNRFNVDHDESFVPTHWTVAGPFLTADDSAIEKDLWRTIGASEETMSLGAAFSKVSALNAPGFKAFENCALLDFYERYKLDKEDKAQRPSFYAKTSVTVDSDCSKLLMVGSDGLLKVWINGELVGRSVSRRSFFHVYDVFFRIDLKKGENIIAIKVVRPVASCGLVACIEPELEHALSTIYKNDGFWLENLLLKAGEYPTVQQREGLDLSRLKVDGVESIRLGNIFPAENDSDRPDLQTDAELCSAHISLGALEWHESFLRGSLDSAARFLIKRASYAQSDKKVALDLEILTRRLIILTSPENRSPSNREWQRKMIYTFQEIIKCFFQHEGREYSLSTQGINLNLNAFSSRIDGQVNCYRIALPTLRKGAENKIPLAIMVPTTMSSSRPFIESAFIAHQFEAEEMARIANELNIGVLWEGYPCQPYGHLCEYTHIDDVLESVFTRYNIDHDRVFIMGTCRAGMTATMMAEHWPARFAGIGLLDPIMTRPINRPDDDPHFFHFDAYKRWINDIAPLNNLGRLRTTPGLVVHDGTAPGHGTLMESHELINAALGVGAAMVLKETPSSTSHMVAWETILRHFAESKACKSTGLLVANDFSNKNIPIAGAVSDSFLLVEPTEASGEGLARMAKIVNDFQAAWKNSHYSYCRQVKDVEVTEEMERKNNLVLVGNDECNLIWRKLKAALPVSIERSRIAIDGKQFSGENLSVEAIYHHPSIPGRKIILIGTSTWSTSSFGTLDLALDGWFDYAVWESKRVSPAPVALIMANFGENNN